MNKKNIVVSLLFFFSGACSLVYELVWARKLCLIFGTTTLAVSTVLTCFFLGLGLGSLYSGHIAGRIKRPLCVYGILEIAVGVYAIFFPLIISICEKNYIYIHNILPVSNIFLSVLIKFFLSFIILSIPTICMGATFPILSRYLIRDKRSLGITIGSLYSINTLGAVAGCISTGFFFIPKAGVDGIIITAGSVNILIGICSLIINIAFEKNLECSPESKIVITAPFVTSRFPDNFSANILLYGFMISGFASLALEVVWTKVLKMIFVGTIYAFTTVLASYLIGIAIGSFIVGKRIDGKSKEGLWLLFGIIELLIGIAAFALIAVYAHLPDIITKLSQMVSFSNHWAYLLTLKVLSSFLILFAPTFLFGATFPIACKLYTGDREVGDSVGTLYAYNTFGAIAGSFSAGFILIPLLGMQKSIILISFLTVSIGLIFIQSSRIKRSGIKTAVTIAVIHFLFLGIYKLLPDNLGKEINRSFLKAGEKILFYTEGHASTVMVAEREGQQVETSNKRLWIDGNRASAAFYEALQINRFQGILPVIFQKDTRETLVICFGTGTTFGTLSEFNIERSTVVEIAPEVIEAAPYFSFENHNVLINPIAEIIIDDGRNFLLTTKRRFDVITQEPMHPSLSGVVNLYTEEYYKLVKSRLTKRGVMSQWIPLYNMSTMDVKMLVKTFKSVFPHTSMWVVSYDMFLLGSPDKFSVNYSHLKRQLTIPSMYKDLKQIDLDDPLELLGSFVMNEENIQRYIADTTTIITDDMPLIEFTSPKQLYEKTVRENLLSLLPYSENIFPYIDFDGISNDEIAGIKEGLYRKAKARPYNFNGRGFMSSGNAREGLKNFSAALSIDPKNKNSLFNLKKLDRMFQDKMMDKLKQH